MSEEQPKTCFVICPIGDEGDEIRQRADEVMEFIVIPAATQCGYATPVRADEIAKPGNISKDIIDHIINDISA